MIGYVNVSLQKAVLYSYGLWMLVDLTADSISTMIHQSMEYYTVVTICYHLYVCLIT